MTEIYLIRHAQAEGNVYRMMQGHWDGDLTALGRRQIEALARRLEGLPFDAVYSSDLYRARMTAEAVTLSRALPLRCMPALREINVGRWETKFFGNVTHAEPELAHAFMYDQEKFSIEGGETYAEVTDRAWAALEEIVRAWPEGRVALVSHGVTIRCLLARITGLSLKDNHALPICRNTAISRVIAENGRYRIESLDDHEHIDHLGESPWGKTGDLRDEPLDPVRDRDDYLGCYSEAWRSVHGSLLGFTPEPYFEAAKRHLAQQADAVMRLYHGDIPAGLVDLDPERGAHAGYGWLSLLYLCPDYRHQGYGVQALARAIFAFRGLGRKALRLHVAQDNAPALAFYRREGFQVLGEEQGRAGKLLLMEKRLEGHGDA